LDGGTLETSTHSLARENINRVLEY
jgi:hypothetical protein